MKRMLAVLLVSIAGLAFAQAPQTSAEPQLRVEDVGWLAGCWGGSMRSGDFEECWTVQKSGHMMGTSRRFKDGKTNFLEFMLLEKDGSDILMTVQHFGPQFRADSKPVSFKLVRLTADEAVFENPRHDHPQRIHYRRTTGGNAECIISMLDGSKKVTFPLQRLGNFGETKTAAK